MDVVSGNDDDASCGEPDFDPTEPLVGLVLCGGKSLRMGEDKADLDFDGETLLQRSTGFLQRDTLEVVLSVGQSARPESNCRQVVDRRSDAGPLAGLEAGLADIAARHGEAWVLVLACDMPRADRDLYDHLLAAAQLTGADAAMFSSEAGDEPLLAVYHTRLLPAISAALDAGERRMNSFHSQPFCTVGSPLGETARLPQIARLGAPSSAPLCNINTPSELTQARAACMAESEQVDDSENEKQS